MATVFVGGGGGGVLQRGSPVENGLSKTLDE